MTSRRSGPPEVVLDPTSARSPCTVDPIPVEIRIENRLFRLTTDGLERAFIDRDDYVRVADKSDVFYLYRLVLPDSKHNKFVFDSCDEIVLHTPATLALAGPNGAGSLGPILARKVRPWQYDRAMLDAHGMTQLQLPTDDPSSCRQLRRILAYDKLTEGDALRFFNHLVENPVKMPPEFWPVFFLWLRDELNHYQGFRAVYDHLFGLDPEQEQLLDEQESDFNHYASILSDPFKLLVSLSYDEAATIAGYRNDFIYYDRAGAPLRDYVRRVTADEGWHFAKFVAMAAKYYPERMDELEDILDEALALEDGGYKRTFFLDHDPAAEAQFDHQLKAKAARIAMRVIREKARRETDQSPRS